MAALFKEMMGRQLERPATHPNPGAEPRAQPLPPGKRVALVVGINAYSKLEAASQLKTAVNDAIAVGKTFKDIGFEVIEGHDLSRAQFNEKWEQFLRMTAPGGVAAFFFAGHGIQIGQQNYLLPSDSPAPSVVREGLVQRESFAFNDLRNDLQAKAPALSLYILDACRNNPYKNSAARGLTATRGLAHAVKLKGTFVMYSADADEEALTGCTMIRLTRRIRFIPAASFRG